VVESLSTVERLIKNTSLVGVKAARIDVDSERLLGSSFHHQRRFVARNIIVVSDRNTGLVLRFVFASRVLHGVLPVILQDQFGFVLLGPQVGSVSISTIASVTARRQFGLIPIVGHSLNAGDKHLLREGQELSSVDGVSSF